MTLGSARRHFGEAGEAEQHRRDGEIADRHHRRLGEADLLAVDEAEEGQDRAGEREPSRLVELALDDEDRHRAEDDAGERRAAAERRQAVIEHAGVAELVEADRRRVGARRAERAVDHGFAPGGDLRDHRQDDRRRVALGVSWNACEPISMPM